MKTMNKIIITDDSYDFHFDENIIFKDLSDENSLIKSISLDILNDSSISFEYNIQGEIKLNIFINIKYDATLILNDKKVGNNFKLKYNYTLSRSSNLIINKINDGTIIKEYDLANLDGENSSIKYILKTICKKDEHYDIVINHNIQNTNSNIITNGINTQDGKMVINVTGFVPKGSINANLNQENRIINLTNHKCQINPNLLIDEENVCANHSAHISNFDKEDLFYIMSRGIDYNNAQILLIKGFLNSLIDNEDYIDNLITKYWG